MRRADYFKGEEKKPAKRDRKLVHAIQRWGFLETYCGIRTVKRQTGRRKPQMLLTAKLNQATCEACKVGAVAWKLEH